MRRQVRFFRTPRPHDSRHSRSAHERNGHGDRRTEFQGARAGRLIRAARVRAVRRRRNTRRGRLRRAGNIAFQRLFRYISGKNVAQQKIAMTAPVTQSAAARREDRNDGTGLAGRRRRRVPRRVHAAGDLHARHGAKPHDPTVQIRAIPTQPIACWRYTGRWTESNYRDNETAARADPSVATRFAVNPSSHATTHPSRPGSCVATKC